MLALAHNPVHNNASKDIEVWYHVVQECVTCGKLSLEKSYTVDNVADPMTKSLSANRFWSLRELMGMELKMATETIFCVGGREGGFRVGGRERERDGKVVLWRACGHRFNSYILWRYLQIGMAY